MLKDYSEIQEAARLFDELIKHQQVASVPVELDRKSRLENTLEDVCRRAGFTSAVLVDADGLSLAVHNNPVEEDKMAGFAAVLADVLDQAGSLLGEKNAGNISLDTNPTEKAVFRRFFINDAPFFLMVLCPRNINEKSELDLTIEQLSSILG